MKNRILLILFIISFFSVYVNAQEKDSIMTISGQKSGKAFISLKSVSLTAGYYSPGMNYVNSNLLPALNIPGKFGGSGVYGANISFNLPLNLGTRLGIWYWEKTASGGSSSEINSLKIGFTGVSLGAFYTYNKGIAGFKPYLGLDGNYLMIQKQFSGSESNIKRSGNDMVWTPFIGVNHEISGKFVVGIEYGYNLGSYVQEMTTATSSDISYHDVSIDGSKIQLSVGYMF